VTLSALLANWDWVVAYGCGSTVVFLWLRGLSSTDAEAAELERQSHAFQTPASLAAVGLNFLRIATAQVLLLAILLSWTARLLVGQWNLWDLLIAASIAAFWPLQEWLIHVTILHLKPFQIWGREIDPIICRNHRNHHRDPWHPHLGITPPHMIWLYLAGLPGVWLLALPIPQALTGISVYFSFVLNYEWLHYLIHTSYVPRTSFYRRLWRNHRLHHFKNEHFWYGVTMLSGDRLFGTQPTASQAVRSETCLTLGVEKELAVWTDEDASALVE
jgi:Fatty acid hydroxylase superfamily